MKTVFHWMALLAFTALIGIQAQSAEDVIADVDLADSEEVGVLHTEKGDLVMRYFPDVAPNHVENMKKLIKDGFYDKTRFHRIIPNFMIQGGCPNTKEDDQNAWGSGSPGHNVKAEFNVKPHVRGTLSMARSNNPDSAGSQFFVCHARAASLDNQYTVFGHLVYGYKTLDTIITAPALPRGREQSLPVKPIAITKAEIMTWGDYKKSAESEKKEEVKPEEKPEEKPKE